MNLSKYWKQNGTPTVIPKKTGKGTTYHKAKPELDLERENRSKQGNETYTTALYILLQMHTAFYAEH